MKNDSEKLVIDELKNNNNLWEERIRTIEDDNAIAFYDELTGDFYIYKESEKDINKVPCGISFERFFSRKHKITLERHIKEYTSNRYLDIYLINNKNISKEEFEEVLSKLNHFTQMSIDKMNNDLKKEATIAELRIKSKNILSAILNKCKPITLFKKNKTKYD